MREERAIYHALRGTVTGVNDRQFDSPFEQDVYEELTRRGLALTPTALGSVLAQGAASAALPATLRGLTSRTVLGYATATGGASASVVAV